MSEITRIPRPAYMPVEPLFYVEMFNGTYSIQTTGTLMRDTGALSGEWHCSTDGNSGRYRGPHTRTDARLYRRASHNEIAHFLRSGGVIR